jgi:hypothetical protein
MTRWWPASFGGVGKKGIGEDLSDLARGFLAEAGDRGEQRAWIDGDFKLLWSLNGRSRLFNVVKNPGEDFDIAGYEPERFRRMSSDLDTFVAQLPRAQPAGAPQEVDDETRRALESLGYLNA